MAFIVLSQCIPVYVYLNAVYANDSENFVVPLKIILEGRSFLLLYLNAQGSHLQITTPDISLFKPDFKFHCQFSKNLLLRAILKIWCECSTCHSLLRKCLKLSWGQGHLMSNHFRPLNWGKDVFKNSLVEFYLLFLFLSYLDRTY